MQKILNDSIQSTSLYKLMVYAKDCMACTTSFPSMATNVWVMKVLGFCIFIKFSLVIELLYICLIMVISFDCFNHQTVYVVLMTVYILCIYLNSFIVF